MFERLKAKPQTLRRIYLEESAALPEHISNLVKTHGIALERAPAKRLSKIKPAKTLQGIVAEVSPFQYAPFEDVLAGVKNKGLSLLFLDRINDPQNLGSIIRTAACFGNFAIIIPKHDACGVTESVLHVASGGENYTDLALVNNLSKAILEAKECGCWIAGAQAKDNAQLLHKTSFPFPLGLVLGFEGKGIRQGILKHLDLEVGIPMPGARLSFNVAIACAILCYEVTKQKNR